MCMQNRIFTAVQTKSYFSIRIFRHFCVISYLKLWLQVCVVLLYFLMPFIKSKSLQFAQGLICICYYTECKIRVVLLANMVTFYKETSRTLEHLLFHSYDENQNHSNIQKMLCLNRNAWRIRKIRKSLSFCSQHAVL